MREHLFRAKRLEDREWVFGSLIQDKSTNEAFITVGRQVLDQNGEKWVVSWSVVRSCFMAGLYGKEYQKSKQLGEMEIGKIIGNTYDL